ncbi:MAG: hypothetical protein AB8B93_04790 [Pseudomonadales bacterium]
MDIGRPTVAGAGRQRRLAELFGGSADAALELIPHLPQALPEDWQAVAAQLAVALPGHFSAPAIIGICGGQGAGKSTLARALVTAFGLVGVRAATVSLDDFYHTRATRSGLAQNVHPLLATRGVPGTHDLALLRHTFEQLAQPKVPLPRFDKATDDRAPMAQWPVVAGPLDLLIFEGWCIGARPQPETALRSPVNDFESREDPLGDYRKYVNQSLARDYAPLWKMLHRWLYLAVPDMAAVARWRGEQEQQLAPAVRMSGVQLDRFIAHYQRLTQWQAESAPELADWCLTLGPDHRLVL